MKTGRNFKKYIDILSDISTVNKIVFCSYIICAIMYALFGYNAFYGGEFTGAKWQPIMYYILLLLPIILGLIDDSESRKGIEFRYSLYLPAVCLIRFSGESTLPYQM